jgi:hypothetical protein
VKRKKQPTDGDQLAAYAVRLLEIAAELRPYGKRALNLSRDEAWEINTDLLTVMDRLRTVQERLMDRIYETRPRARRGYALVLHRALKPSPLGFP